MSADSRFFLAMLSYPPSWIIILITPAAVASFLVWFQPPTALAAAVLVLGGGLLIIWPPLLASDTRFHRSYYRLASRIDQDDISRLFRLEQRLRDSGTLGQQGAATLYQLRDSFDFLSRIFVRRLHSGELVYGRYLATSEQLFLIALSNAEAALGQLAGNGSPPLSAQAQAELERRLGINQRIVGCFDAIANGLTEIRVANAYEHPALQPHFTALEQLVSGTKSVRDPQSANQRG